MRLRSRWHHTTIVLVLAILTVLALALASNAGGQSTEKLKPTPLPGREIIGRANYQAPRTGWAKSYYYVFTAGPGDVEVSMLTKSPAPGRSKGGWFEWRFENGRKPDDHVADELHDVRYAVTFNEYSGNNTHGAAAAPTSLRRPSPLGLIAPNSKEMRAISTCITLPQKIRILMTVNLSGRFDYRIRLDGPVIGVDPR